jgi:hypothetical protein
VYAIALSWKLLYEFTTDGAVRVLLSGVACANLANLLAHTVAGRKEIAVRLARAVRRRFFDLAARNLP